MKSSKLIFVLVIISLLAGTLASCSPTEAYNTNSSNQQKVAVAQGSIIGAEAYDAALAKKTSNLKVARPIDLTKENPQQVQFIMQSGAGAVVAFCLADDLTIIGIADDWVILAIAVGGAAIYFAPELSEALDNLAKDPRNVPARQVKLLQATIYMLAAYLWSLQPFENSLKYFAEGTSSSDWQEVFDINPFKLPDPKSKCGLIETLFGAPCRWRVFKGTTQGGNEMIKIVLEVKDQIIVRAEALKVTLADYSELGPALVDGAFKGIRTGWITYMEVVEWAKGIGLGRLIWQATDAAIKGYSLKELAVHIFVDASKMGWGETLLANVDKVAVGIKTWLYIIQ